MQKRSWIWTLHIHHVLYIVHEEAWDSEQVLCELSKITLSTVARGPNWRHPWRQWNKYIKKPSQLSDEEWERGHGAQGDIPGERDRCTDEFNSRFAVALSRCFFKDGEIKLYILEWSPPVSCWITLHPFPSSMLDYSLPFCLYELFWSYFAVLR